MGGFIPPEPKPIRKPSQAKKDNMILRLQGKATKNETRCNQKTKDNNNAHNEEELVEGDQETNTQTDTQKRQMSAYSDDGATIFRVLGPRMTIYDDTVSDPWNIGKRPKCQWDQSKLTDFFATEAQTHNERINKK